MIIPLNHLLTNARLLVDDIWLAAGDPVDDPDGVQIHVSISPTPTPTPTPSLTPSPTPTGGSGGTGGGLPATGADLPDLLIWGGIGLVVIGAAIVVVRLIRNRRRTTAAEGN